MYKNTVKYTSIYQNLEYMCGLDFLCIRMMIYHHPHTSHVCIYLYVVALIWLSWGLHRFISLPDYIYIDTRHYYEHVFMGHCDPVLQPLCTHVHLPLPDFEAMCHIHGYRAMTHSIPYAYWGLTAPSTSRTRQCLDSLVKTSDYITKWLYVFTGFGGI